MVAGAGPGTLCPLSDSGDHCHGHRVTVDYQWRLFNRLPGGSPLDSCLCSGVKYTSTELQSQIYIGSVNWILLVAVVFVMLIFRQSGNLAAAYGLAVMGSMTTTSLMMIMIFTKFSRWKLPVTVTICLINLVYLFFHLQQDPARRLLVPGAGVASL